MVKPAQIHYLRFILEAYEGIASMTTRDPSLGWIQLNIAPGNEIEVHRILAFESRRLGLRHLTLTGAE